MGNHISSALTLALIGRAAAETYDVIVIGSGPGGLVAAEYLSRNASVSVLVLEAGLPSMAASGGNIVPSYAQAQGWTLFDIPGEYTNIAFGSDARFRIGSDWIASPGPLYLGKTVGGSSSLNGMLYFRTPDAYVSEASWPYDAATVNRGYAAVESMFTYTNTPSGDGRYYNQPAYAILKDVLGSGGGYTESPALNSDDRNAKSKSFGHPPFSIKDGLRDTPAKTFLSPALARGNFKLEASATVSHVVQAGGQASAVVYTRNGQSMTASLSARGVVVVAGGAAMTPKILIQSGVGPRSQLELLANNGNFPGVGRDQTKWAVNENVGNSIFDTNSVMMTMSRSDMVAFQYSPSATAAIQQYMTQGQAGPWASPNPVFIGYESVNQNQFQVTGFCHGFTSSASTAFAIAVYLNNPAARDQAGFGSDGRYRLNTRNTMYTNGGDRAAMAAYLDKLRGWMSARGVAQITPNAGTSSTDFVNSNVGGANHYGGSCYTSGDKNDGRRCADETFKVIGTSNIFVADASLMKTGTVNPMGFVMYAGYQAGINVAAAIASGPTPPTQPPTVAPGTCSNYQTNTDYYGNDISHTFRPSAASCCADCMATQGCKLYVWNDANGGTCWLKSSAGAASNLPGAQSAFVGSDPSTPTPSTCSNYQTNTDYYGNDIAHTSRSSAASCCGDCAATAGCKLYVWNNANGGTCWLKSSAGTASNLPGAQSAFIGSTPTTPTPTTPSPPSTCGTPLRDTDFTGQDVGNVPGATPDACCAACMNNKQCNAYSIWNNTCWLKSGSNNPHPANGVTAATVNKCSALEQDVDYTGNDIGNTASAAASGCCATCRNTNGCKAFSWFQGTCYLKSGKGAQTNKSGVVSATVLY